MAPAFPDFRSVYHPTVPDFLLDHKVSVGVYQSDRPPPTLPAVLLKNYPLVFPADLNHKSSAQVAQQVHDQMVIQCQISNI